MSRETCRECGQESGAPVAVALNHVNSTGGHVVYVCPACRTALGLVPLDEHAAGSLGFPQFEDRIPESERWWGTAPFSRKGPATAP